MFECLKCIPFVGSIYELVGLFLFVCAGQIEININIFWITCVLYSLVFKATCARTCGAKSTPALHNLFRYKHSAFHISHFTFRERAEQNAERIMAV